MAIQTTTHSHTFVGSRASKPGTGALTLFAPRNVSAVVAANIVKKYRTSSAVKTDHASGSIAHLAAQIVVQNTQGEFRIGAFGDLAAAASSLLTFGTSTVGNNSGAAGAAPTGFDPLPAANLPLYEVTTCAIDGVAVSRIKYTTGDATAATLDNTLNGEVLVNPKTGSWKTSRNTSGAGAGVVFTIKSPDLTLLKAQALTQPIEVVTFAGWRYTEQYYGVYDNLVAWAASNGLMVYAALPDNLAAPTGGDAVDTLIRAIRSDSFQVVGSKLSDPTADFTTGYAVVQANAAPNGTLKGQPAPKGFTYSTSLPYTRDEYGDDFDPSVGTFHQAGANVITLNQGTFVFSSDRAMTDYSDATDVLFAGVRRTLNAALGLVDFRLQEALSVTGAATPIFDDLGLEAVKGAFTNGLNEAVRKRYIRDDFVLRAVALADTFAADRKKRGYVGNQIEMTVTTAMQTINYTIEVSS